MMESCFNDRLEKIEAVSIEDLKKDLSGEFLSMSSVTSEESSLQEREHLQVYLRIRPFTQAEMDSDESQECVSIENPDKVFLKAPRSSLSSRLSDKSLPQTAQRFQFSQVYGPEATQKEVFDGTVKSLVKDFLQGGNSLVFTYGVTNAGKTFTFLGPENNSGLLPRSLNMIFNNIQDKIYTEMDIKPQRCREYMRLNKEQLTKEIANKKTILRLAKECDLQKSMISQLNSTSKSAIFEGTAVNNTEELDSESFTLDMNSHSKYSVWVSFCEIYNENIYDLLETIPNNSMKRSTLRLSQDVKGNPFVKDLKWVQVSDADEAYKVLKLGKKHQSFSCTKLNHLSSRSHSIFSIRILRIEDLGIPRVQNISELSLCDLAGSERCAKTQNKGERLKEAGNINSSLLILGKCLKALRHNQQSKLLQHVPFRESKLTHYLQGFFCGRGKACMIVNINQCASMFDETLNVLKFSALAQKVVVLSTTKLAPVVPKKSAREVSFIINNADKMRFWRKRRSSLIGWDTSLEDVQENDDGEEKEEEESLEETMEDIIQEEEEEEEEVVVSKESYEKLLSVIEELKKKIVEERSEKLLLESRIREDVSQEFMQLYSQMESDFSERLENEREIIEERAETRMEILKNLVCKKNDQHNVASEDAKQPQEDQIVVLDGIIGCMQDDLVSIKKDAEAAQNCLVALPDLQEKITQLEIKVAKLSEEKNKTEELLSLKTKEVEAYFSNQTNDQLEEAKRSLECQNEKLQGLMEICQEKDEMISKLQTALDHWEETVAKNKTSTDAIKEEILNLKINCTCSGANNPSSGNESRKRPCAAFPDPEGQPPLKKGPLPEENHCVATPKMDELQAELNLKEMEVEKLKFKVDELQQQLGSLRRHFQEEIKLKDEITQKIKDQLLCSEQKVKELSDNLQQQVSSYEATVTAWQEQRDENQKIAAQKEKVANEMSDLRQEATQKEVLLKNMEDAVRAQTEKFEKVSAELSDTKDLLRKLEVDFNEKLQLVESLTNQTERLKHELEASQVLAAKRDSGHFRDTIGALRAECEKVVKESALKSQQIVDLEQEVSTFKRQIAEQDQLSSQLKRELDGVNSANAEFNSKEDLVNQLRDQLESASKQLESERRHVAEIQQRYSALEATSVNLRGEIRDLEEQLQVSKSNVDKVVALEQQLSGKESLIAELQSSLEEAQSKLKGATSSLSLQAAKLKEAEQSMESLRLAKETIAEKDTQLGKSEQELLRLKEEMSDKLLTIKSLNLDLGRKEEDASDLKEKVADAKKQIQQVEKEISTLREENRTLKQKLSEMEKSKNQMMNDLKSRDQTIQLFKSEQSNATVKSDQNLELYQKACKDLQARQQIIEDMRLALTEQEETQAEQDRVLEAKMEEIESLTSEVENMKNKFNQNKLDGMAAQNLDEHNSDAELARQEVTKLKETFQIANEKYQADRKKWQEDKFMLIKQAKEAEERRNHDVKRFAEDRERYSKQQMEMESLRKQLAEKDNDLERWRKERDDLVEALDVQLRNLILSNQQKDNELEKLRADATFMAGKASNGTNIEDLQRILTDKESEISKLKEQLRILTEPNSKLQPAETDRKLQKLGEVKSANKTNSMLFQDGNNLKSSNKYNTSSSEESEALGNNQSVLDSSGISSESGRTSRFPKPELEIQFTPLRPNKMEVKMQGEDSAVTVKLGKSARKRKSNEMEMSDILSGCWKNKTNLKATHEIVSQDLVESENRKNSRTRTIARNVKEQSPAANRNVASLKQQVSSSSLKSANKKDGPLQKIGDFIQSSPTFLQNKAKKLIGTLSSRSPEPELGPLDSKPKRSKRKLYKTEISSPLDIPSHPIVGLDRDEKESDHLIIKRRLRPRTAKR
ncbi:kinesin-like protein KIF20B isoform X1 [Lepisosteus oculatus]|uniref:kinesin-like protein KIF20B isoform X1 n=1 Tax=Lepisosteus oculatus TaxID=7918 RepID=UPI0037107187